MESPKRACGPWPAAAARRLVPPTPPHLGEIAAAIGQRQQVIGGGVGYAQAQAVLDGVDVGRHGQLEQVADVEASCPARGGDVAGVHLGRRWRWLRRSLGRPNAGRPSSPRPAAAARASRPPRSSGLPAATVAGGKSTPSRRSLSEKSTRRAVGGQRRVRRGVQLEGSGRRPAMTTRSDGARRPARSRRRSRVSGRNPTSFGTGATDCWRYDR